MTSNFQGVSNSHSLDEIDSNCLLNKLKRIEGNFTLKCKTINVKNRC